MRALVIDAPRNIRVGDWDTPRPGPGEVLVAPRAVGVCAGDLYIYLGKNAYVNYPAISGHEISGVVVETGPGVEGIPAGAPVVVEPFIGCGTCYPCRVGKPNCCTTLQIIGVTRPGGFAELLVVPAEKVFRIPDGLGFTAASFAEPVAIGVQGCRRGQLSAGELVLVIGCGPIGLALIEVARSRGARVLATDVLESRRETASRLGAEVLPPDERLLPAVLERTGGEGAPVVMEATGAAVAMETTVDLVASGGRIVILGLLKKGDTVRFPGLDITRKEMTIVGSRASRDCFPESIELLARGLIRYPAIATEFDLWEGARVIRELAEKPGRLHKAVLVNA